MMNHPIWEKGDRAVHVRPESAPCVYDVMLPAVVQRPLLLIFFIAHTNERDAYTHTVTGLDGNLKKKKLYFFFLYGRLQDIYSMPLPIERQGLATYTTYSERPCEKTVKDE